MLKAPRGAFCYHKTMDHEPVPTEELIKVGVIKGHEALEWLDSHGEYVYHGSTQRLDRLEPRQASHDGEPDGQPAVAASDNPEIATFRALVSSHASRESGRGHHYSSFGVKDGKVCYEASSADLEAARSDDAVGYVHVFRRGDFDPYPRHDYEFRSGLAVEPRYIIEVRASDLPPDIGVSDNPSSKS